MNEFTRQRMELMINIYIHTLILLSSAINMMSLDVTDDNETNPDCLQRGAFYTGLSCKQI